MKPKEKVVSAEDVLTSLYFLHVACPEDEQALSGITAAAPRDEFQGRKISQAASSDIARKPVYDEHMRRDMYGVSPDISSRMPYPPQSPHSVSRKPIHNDPLMSRTDVEDRQNTSHSMPARKPVGAVTTYQENISPGVLPYPLKENKPRDRESLLANKRSSEIAIQHPYSSSSQYVGFNAQKQHFQPENSSSLAPPSSMSADMSPLQSNAEAFNDPFYNSKPIATIGTTLTLIRRDPGSGSQWNVATIHDRPIAEISSEPYNMQPKGQGAPLFIEITNPGYSKFMLDEEGVPPMALRRESGSSISTNQTRSLATSRTFQRQIWMEGMKPSKNGFAHGRTHSREDSQTFASTEALHNKSRTSLDFGRQPQGLTSGLNQYMYDSKPDLSESNVRPRMMERAKSSFRGYVFLSPWNGRCEFVTTGGGNALRVSC
jgi:hypothetical protein